MNISIQKASIGKRIIAAIFDGIILSIIAVGMATLLSMSFGYNGHVNTLVEAQARYEQEYGVKFNITQQEYDEMTEEQKAQYEAADKAFSEDPDVVYAGNMLSHLSLIIITFSVLIAVAAVEFGVPLFFGNGQTLGKKIFGIAVMHTDSIKVNTLQLFVRAILGKYTLEIMIPLSIVMMIFFNSIGIVSIAVLLLLLIAQLICFFTSRTNSLLHDTLSGTVTVDLASQRIFDTREQLIEHIKAVHEEQASRSTY